jgi:hypothetical protein
MALDIRQLDYGTLSKKLRTKTKAVALHPYLRLFVFLTTFIALFSAVVIKDESLPTLTSPTNAPSGFRAWDDLRAITQQPHPYNTRENDQVREYILSEMKKRNLCR